MRERSRQKEGVKKQQRTSATNITTTANNDKRRSLHPLKMSTSFSTLDPGGGGERLWLIQHGLSWMAGQARYVSEKGFCGILFE